MSNDRDRLDDDHTVEASEEVLAAIRGDRPLVPDDLDDDATVADPAAIGEVLAGDGEVLAGDHTVPEDGPDSPGDTPSDGPVDGPAVDDLAEDDLAEDDLADDRTIAEPNLPPIGDSTIPGDGTLQGDRTVNQPWTATTRPADQTSSTTADRPPVAADPPGPPPTSSPPEVVTPPSVPVPPPPPAPAEHPGPAPAMDTTTPPPASDRPAWRPPERMRTTSALTSADSDPSEWPVWLIPSIVAGVVTLLIVLLVVR